MATSLGELAPLEGVKRWAFAEGTLRLRLVSALPTGRSMSRRRGSSS